MTAILAFNVVLYCNLSIFLYFYYKIEYSIVVFEWKISNVFTQRILYWFGVKIKVSCSETIKFVISHNILYKSRRNLNLVKPANIMKISILKRRQRFLLKYTFSIRAEFATRVHKINKYDTNTFTGLRNNWNTEKKIHDFLFDNKSIKYACRYFVAPYYIST